MKQLLSAFLVAITFYSFGQDDFKRFQIGVNFSPEVAYRFLSLSLPQSMRNEYNDIDAPKFGYTTGINFCYNIKSFVGVEIGAQYSNKGFKTKIDDLVFDPLSSNATNTYKSTLTYHYIDIPVKVNFTVGKKKVRFFTSVGLATNILIKEFNAYTITDNSTKQVVEKENSGNTAGVKRVNLSPMLSVGIDYKINNRMNFRAEPTFRVGVLNNYLFNAGVNLAYYFGL